MKIKYYQIATILASIITISTIIILSFMTKDQTLFITYISDLGVREYAIIFNLGMIISGLLVWPFAFHAFKKDKYLGALLFITSTALAGVGTFTEASALHYPVSAAFFTFAFITILYVGVKNRKTNIGKLAITISLLAFITFPFFKPFIETVYVFVIAIALAIFAFNKNL